MRKLKRKYRNKQLKQQLAEKDKEIEELQLEAMRWEEHFNNARMDYQCLEESKNEEISELRNQLNKNDKDKRHQICEENGAEPCEFRKFI